MLTLWDLLPKPRSRARPKPPSNAQPKPAPPPARKPAKSAAPDKYLRMERDMLARYGIRVRKWRSNTSGVAWEVHYRDGSLARLIESPRPRGPVSAAVFLHEIGHHAIGFHRYKPRCLEEYHAWRFALEQMPLHGINITPRVRKRVAESLEYAIAKAVRRGLRAVPAEVAACIAEQRQLLAEEGPSARPPRAVRAGADALSPPAAPYSSSPNSASMNASGSNA